MARDAGTSEPTFKEQEQAGWGAKASAYDDYAGRITTQIVEALLDAAAVQAGTELLDVACGPGYLAGAAAKRGANAIGTDFAPAMLSEAKKNFPRAEFRQGDAEALQFESGAFDAVVCGFGLGHLPEADKALLEAFRVLRPGGRYAFSWWCAPDKHEFFALVMGAVKAHGTLEVPLPPAPPMFRFSDPVECKRALSRAGFSDVEAQEHELRFDLQSPQQALDLISKSSVRMAMVLDLQTTEARTRIDKAILAGVQAYKRERGFSIGWPALVANGKKPSS
jgi:SAM-dependent methyltransferase